MNPRFENQSRLSLETLEDRTVPSGCAAFGAHVADFAQTFVPLGTVVISPIAQGAPGAVAAQIAVDFVALCP